MTHLVPPAAVPNPTNPTSPTGSNGSNGAPTHRTRFLVAAGAYVAATTVAVVASLSATGGRLTYAFDDPYIHLTMAETLADHGTWGLDPGTFEAASSSPLWLVLLAVAGLVASHGALEVVPFVFGVAAAGWALRSASGSPIAWVGHRRAALLASAALPIALGLPALTLMGMEHTLHVAICLQALVLLHRWATADGADRRRAARWLVAVVALGSLTRLETAYVALAIAAVLVVGTPAARRGGGRPWRLAAAVVAAAAVPNVLLGAAYLSFDRSFLANSVIAKSDLRGGSALSPGAALRGVTTDAVLLVLLVTAAAVALLWRSPRFAPVGGPRVTSPVVAVLHAAVLATTLFCIGGPVSLFWLSRYQAFAVAMLVVALVWSASVAERRMRLAALVVAFGATIPVQVAMTARAVDATAEVRNGQFLTARLLEEWDPEAPVAVNDLGVVAWTHPGRVIDLWGLGSYEVLQARDGEPLTARDAERIVAAEGVEVVAIYEEWFTGGIPDSWTPVGALCLTDADVAGGACVTYFAVDPADAEPLRAALDGVADDLPPGTVHVPAG